MGADSVLLLPLSKFLYPCQNRVKDVFLLRGGGGASSGPSAKMILTQISVSFIYKKLGWREFQPTGLSGKEKNQKIIKQEGLLHYHCKEQNLIK